MKPSPPAAGSVNPTVPIAVRLSVRYLGNVPAIKNSFHAVVDRRHREWKRQCIGVFVSQLRSILATADPVTLTTPSLPSLIASLPHDDNWRVIQEIRATAVGCPTDEAGADIIIEILP